MIYDLGVTYVQGSRIKRPVYEKVFALIDCNNFFVSCERIFRPDLEGKSVVVLSSGDGCVVARSNEAKALDIPMGAPAFQYRQIFKDKRVVQFSANFELYGNISKRITQILTEVCPRIEVYSVDESFLDLSDLTIKDYEQWGRDVRARILREVGVPVSVGIASTKTLAKLASEIAKRDDLISKFRHSRAGGNRVEASPPEALNYPAGSRIKSGMTAQGVVSFIDAKPEFLDQALAATPIREVWGVGRKLAPKLQAEGIGNALALANMRPQYAQKTMGIRGRQMVAELNGVSCLPLEMAGRIAKSLMRSRTFGEDTSELYVLEAAVASLATQAAFRLRSHSLLARSIGVFAGTNRHKPGYKRWSRELRLSTPTSDSGQIISQLVNLLQDFYTASQSYHRLGVFLYDFVPAGSLQTDLFGFVDAADHDRSAARMRAVDRINSRHGKNKIHYAAEELASSWQPKHSLRSPRYVSDWAELPNARILRENNPINHLIRNEQAPQETTSRA